MAGSTLPDDSRPSPASHRGGATAWSERLFRAPPLLRGTSGERPPLPTATAPAKKRRPLFVVPPPRPTAPPPGRHQDPAAPRPTAPPPGRHQDPAAPRPTAPPPGRHQDPAAPRPTAPPPAVSTAAATKASRPCARVEDLRPSPALLPSSSSFDPPPAGFLRPPALLPSQQHGASWDTALPVSYEAVGDDQSPTRTQMFDWTPTLTLSMAHDVANGPTPSQGYMNLLTQDADPELEVLTELPTPSSGSRGSSRRGNNYNHDDDIQLCVSWMNISNDLVVGNEQGAKSYWSRITDHYNENKTSGTERTASSLEHRWGVVQKECMKFQGYFEAVERRHRSGISYKEHLIEAQARYSASSPKGRAFQFIHCWLKVRHCEKFISLQEAMKQGNRPSKSSTPSEGHDPAPDSEVPPAKRDRPPGRKQSKDKLKRSQGGDDYEELLENLVQIKTAEHKQREERWNRNNLLEERRLQMEEKREERRLQMEEKRLEWEKEREIMFCDVSKLDSDQRTYVLAMRAQIAKEKVASLSSAGSASGDGDSCA